jgi:xylulokinase
MYRALLEGIALEQALVSGMIEQETAQPIREFIAIGGGAASGLWCRILADATGKVIRRPRTVEASSLGAAICAAVGAGWFPSATLAAESMSGEITQETHPDPGGVQRYRDLTSIYRDLYPLLRDPLQRLSRAVAQASAVAQA